ncbi:MAG: hypothetical protein GY910_14715 [bacterium]|nr:hypothetical protein [bacterium]
MRIDLIGRRVSRLISPLMILILFALPTLATHHDERDGMTTGVAAGLVVKRFMVFLPAKDLALSKRFYLAMGAELVDDGGDYAEFKWADDRFILRSETQNDWAENFGVHVIVEDAAAFARRAQELVASGNFPEVRVEGPRDEPWKYRVTYVWDPSGVGLRFSQSLK